ncbi:MAG: hypothetical protein SWZ49_14485 [Cyanobacteriota bacterium]|nr:hypothetical protein [Cyanobacteriota bacterium]
MSTNIIKILKQDKEKLEKDYEAVAEKKRRESNPVEKRNLQLDLDSILKEIEDIQGQINNANNQKFQYLKEILSKFTTKEEISIIKKAYRACSPEGWHFITTDEPEKILVDVMKMPKGNSKYTKVEHFVACLFALIKNPSLVAGLKNWAEENINEFDDLFKKEKQELERKRQENKNPYLIVRVKENSSKKDYYFVDAWLIPDGDTYHYEEKPNCKQLDKSKDTFTLKEIRVEIKNFLDEIGEYASSKLIVEIFLPLNVINEAVDSWEIENEFGLVLEKLSLNYKVVVRSTERCEKIYNRFRGKWKEKWNDLQDLIENSTINNFVYFNDGNLNELLPELTKRNHIGIQFQKTPIKTGKGSVFAAILTTAIPIALWLRHELSLNFNEQVDGLGKCCIEQLIETVAEKRREALKKPQDSHIGHHISLLWENPNRLPPDITYSM